MTTTLGQGNGRNRNILMLATAAAFLAAVMLATTAPAHAKDNGHHKHGKGHGSHGAHGNPHRYVVPHVLTPQYRGSFKPYYNGRAYYAPHHHYHARYRLPVYYGDAVVYRPYAYCGDQLFVTGAVNLPQLALAFNFGAPGGGFAIGGYYQAPPPPPAPYYYEDRYDHDDCHHGR